MMFKPLMLLMVLSGLQQPLFAPFATSRARGFAPFAVVAVSAPAFDEEVADAPQRLSLSPSTTVGYKVKQADTLHIYQYNGVSTDDVAGVTISGGAGGVFVVSGTQDGKNKYTDVDEAQAHGDVIWDPAADHGNGGWTGGGGAPTGDTTYPWEADWSGDGLTVTKDDVASEANWTDLGP